MDPTIACLTSRIRFALLRRELAAIPIDVILANVRWEDR